MPYHNKILYTILLVTLFTDSVFSHYCFAAEIGTAVVPTQTVSCKQGTYYPWCIKCYYCNSENNTACLDVNQYSEDIRMRIVPVVNCESAIPSPGGYRFFCRKIAQTIFHSHRESEIRVTRGCGWIQHDKPCYRDDNSDHLGTSCQCFEDYCNSSERLDPTTMTGIFFFFCDRIVLLALITSVDIELSAKHKVE